MTTRRAFLSGSAALALMARTMPHAFASCVGRDPIFSRIEAHRAAGEGIAAAFDALEAAERTGNRRAINAATRAQAKAVEHEADMLAALVAEPPETVEGAHALAAYLAGFLQDSGGLDHAHAGARALGNIAATLASTPRVPRF
jgi:hypothetical protein